MTDYGPLPPERVIHLMRQTCDALSEAHQARLVQRDIKPANIFAAHRGGLHDVRSFWTLDWPNRSSTPNRRN